jgi:hypothetical protein
MTTAPGNHHHPKNKHPYRFYWLTGGLATILAAIITVSVTHCSGPVNPPIGQVTTPPGPVTTSPGPVTTSPGPNPLPSNVLLTSADMAQAAGGSWEPLAANAQSLRFSCFPLPTSPSRSQAVELSESNGARLYEIADSFSSAARASQAYASFTSAANNCQWQNTNKEGVTSQFTVVADSNGPNLDSASSLWDIQGVPVALGGAPSHDGAMCAVQSSNLDAFAVIIVDSSNSPSMTILENNIEPALANKL